MNKTITGNNISQASLVNYVNRVLNLGLDVHYRQVTVAMQECPAPRLFVGTGHVQRRIISWELARELRRDLTRQWLDAVYG